MQKPVVVEKIDRAVSTDAERRIAQMENGSCPRVRTGVKYLNIENGEEYQCLAGGFAWPSLRASGHAVIVGVHIAEENHVFICLEEHRHKTVRGLLEGAYRLHQRYAANCNTVGFQWVGTCTEPRALEVARFNETVKSELYFSPANDYIQKNSDDFQAYVEKFYFLFGQARLTVGRCQSLRNVLENFDTQNIEADSFEKGYPAIVALGGVVSFLDTVRPWLREPYAWETPINEEDVLWREEREIYRIERIQNIYDDYSLLD